MTRYVGLRCAAVILVLLLAACSSAKKTGEDADVTSRGEFEVTAKLAEIPGEFPPNDLYDYAFVLKYDVLKVHRGNITEKSIYVGQYNPLKPRTGAADARSGEIGGDVTTFRKGDVHRLALAAPIDDHFMGGIVDHYDEPANKRIYWAIWTNQASE